jgi:putative transposase
MGQFLVLPDVIAVAADRLVVIVRVEDDGSVVLRDLANGTLRTTSASELSAPPSSSDPALAYHDIATATDTQWERARRREAVVASITHSGSGDVGEQITLAAARLGVSRRTLFRWLALYRDAPQTSSLLPHPRGTPAGAHRLDPKVESLIADAIRDVYLTKVRAKKEEVVRQVQLRCAAQGVDVPSRKAILARVRALDVREAAKARLQPKEAAALHDPVPGTYHVDRALDVVQIDHTRVDVVVVDEAQRLPIGRPWLSLAVDVATRVVTVVAPIFCDFGPIFCD